MGDGTFNAPKFGLFGATFHAADPYGMKGTIRASDDPRWPAFKRPSSCSRFE